MEVVPQRGVLQWNGDGMMNFLFSTLASIENALFFIAQLKWVVGVCGTSSVLCTPSPIEKGIGNGFIGAVRWQKNMASNKNAIPLKNK